MNVQVLAASDWVWNFAPAAKPVNCEPSPLYEPLHEVLNEHSRFCIVVPSNCEEPLIRVGLKVNSANVISSPTNRYLKSNDSVTCAAPLTIPDGIEEML
jgi:hypothetical protein